jgi:hypothetical protein
MASIVEWQSLKMQEYRYTLYNHLAKALEVFGIRKLARFEHPVPAGEFEDAMHNDHPEAPSFLHQYMPKPEPKLGGKPNQTANSQHHIH